VRCGALPSIQYLRGAPGDDQSPGEVGHPSCLSGKKRMKNHAKRSRSPSSRTDESCIRRYKLTLPYPKEKGVGQTTKRFHEVASAAFIEESYQRKARAKCFQHRGGRKGKGTFPGGQLGDTSALAPKGKKTTRDSVGVEERSGKRLRLPSPSGRGAPSVEIMVIPD